MARALLLMLSLALVLGLSTILVAASRGGVDESLRESPAKPFDFDDDDQDEEDFPMGTLIQEEAEQAPADNTAEATATAGGATATAGGGEATATVPTATVPPPPAPNALADLDLEGYECPEEAAEDINSLPLGKWQKTPHGQTAKLVCPPAYLGTVRRKCAGASFDSCPSVTKTISPANIDSENGGVTVRETPTEVGSHYVDFKSQENEYRARGALFSTALPVPPKGCLCKYTAFISMAPLTVDNEPSLAFYGDGLQLAFKRADAKDLRWGDLYATPDSLEDYITLDGPPMDGPVKTGGPSQAYTAPGFSITWDSETKTLTAHDLGEEHYSGCYLNRTKYCLSQKLAPPAGWQPSKLVVYRNKLDEGYAFHGLKINMDCGGKDSDSGSALVALDAFKQDTHSVETGGDWTDHWRSLGIVPDLFIDTSDLKYSKKVGAGSYLFTNDPKTIHRINLRKYPALTLEAWFRPSSVSSTDYVVGTSTEFGPKIYLNHPEAEGIYAETGGRPYKSKVGPAKENHWYHVVAVFHGTQSKLYVNYHFQQGFTSMVSHASMPLSIGDFNGHLGQVRVYDRALTDTEVKAQFDANKRKYGFWCDPNSREILAKDNALAGSMALPSQTGIMVHEGDPLLIEVEASDMWKGGEGMISNADGMGFGWTPYTDPKSGQTFPIGSLVARVDWFGKWFKVGTKFNGFAPATGPLQMVYWDNDNADNSGSIYVKVSSHCRECKPDSVNVYAAENQAGFKSALFSGAAVNVGDNFRITAEASQKWTYGEDKTCDFAGDTDDEITIDGEIGSFPRGALVARIGKIGDWFLVGASIYAKASWGGGIYLAIWDNTPEDNSGFINVVVNPCQPGVGPPSQPSTKKCKTQTVTADAFLNAIHGGAPMNTMITIRRGIIFSISADEKDVWSPSNNGTALVVNADGSVAEGENPAILFTDPLTNITHPVGTLMGRVGLGAWFMVGHEFKGAADKTGLLQLACWGDAEGNSGGLEVTINPCEGEAVFWEGPQDACTCNCERAKAPWFTTAPIDLVYQCRANVTLEQHTLESNAACDQHDQVDKADVAITNLNTCPNDQLVVRTYSSPPDACGKQAVHVQRILFNDTFPPVFLSPPLGNIELKCEVSRKLEDHVGLTDNCDPNPKLLYSDDTIVDKKCKNKYKQIRTWVGTDCSGNSDKVTQTVNVDDDIPPTLVAESRLCMWPANDAIAVVPKFSTEPNFFAGTDNCGGDTFVKGISCKFYDGTDKEKLLDVEKDECVYHEESDTMYMLSHHEEGTQRTYVISGTLTDECGNGKEITREITVPILSPEGLVQACLKPTISALPGNVVSDLEAKKNPTGPEAEAKKDAPATAEEEKTKVPEPTQEEDVSPADF